MKASALQLSFRPQCGLSWLRSLPWKAVLRKKVTCTPRVFDIDIETGYQTNYAEVTVYDFDPNTTNLVSVNFQKNRKANGRSRRPLISPDGRFVVFQSQATDLIADAPPDTSGNWALYLRDVEARKTYELTPPSLGPAVRYAWSADSRTLVFTTGISNPDAGDYNAALDIYQVRITDDAAGFRVLIMSSVTTHATTVLWPAASEKNTGCSSRIS